MHVAHRLALQTFQRHIVQQKRRHGQLQVLEQRYTRYLQLLASDSQVPPPSLSPFPYRVGMEALWACFPRREWGATGCLGLGPDLPPTTGG